MKLTVEQVAKITKLSIPTLRVYISRQKLGTKVGNTRYLTQNDVNKILKKKSPPSRNKKAATRVKTSKSIKQIESSREAPNKPTEDTVAKKNNARESIPKKRSFWSFFQREPKEKINLLDAKGFKS